MRTNEEILTAVSAAFVKEFVAQGFTASRAALLIGITPAAASQYLTGKRGGEINKLTRKKLKESVLYGNIPRKDLFEACALEVELGHIVIKTTTRKNKEEPDVSLL